MEMNMVRAADKNSKELKEISGLNLRYEKKFICVNDNLEDLIEELYLNSFCFKEIYQKRRINNLYFDDYDLNFYKQNVSGVGLREKYRIRWYGDDFSKIEYPTIEIKRKYGEVGDKISHKINELQYDLDLGDVFELQQLIINHLNDHQFLKNAFYQLSPALLNSYDRRYFLSACEKFRVTLDYGQRFYNPNIPRYVESKKAIDDRIIILELKYNTQHDFEARQIPQQFSYRVSRNSKYVQGIDLVNGQALF